MRRTHVKIAVTVIVLVVMLAGTFALAKGRPKGPKICKDFGLFCLDVWDPVICDDGNVYSNDCYARRACATGCEPYGAF